MGGEEPTVDRHLARDIVEDARNGYEFVPLLGSGISANSGIPIGAELVDALLPYIVAVVRHGWNHKKNDWNNCPVTQRISQDDFIRETMEWVAQAKGWRPVSDDGGENPIDSEKSGPTPDDVRRPGWQIALNAVGSLPNWRTGLEFLSRVAYVGEEGAGEWVLGPPSRDVIDLAFHYLVSDKKPNFAHYMLAQLAGALRIRTLLTTNFDELTEMAFEQMDLPLTRFEVPLNMQLPAPDLVHQHRSIVKLHGGMLGLRADMSLDLPPTNDDKEAFIKYLKPREVSRTRRLLVMGIGGGDKRILDLIEAARDELKDELVVYWVSHSDPENNPAKERFRKLFLIVREQRPLDLFLLDLYQKYYGSPPAGGFRYSSVVRVPPLPYGVDPYVGKKMENRFYREQEFEDAVNDFVSKLNNRGGANIVKHTGFKGISSVAAEAFRRHTELNHCAWIDLDLCLGIEDFKIHLLEAIADQVGRLDSLYPLPSIGAKEIYLECVKELLGDGIANFTCFLYVREGYGSNTGWVERTELADPPYKWAEGNDEECRLVLEGFLREVIEGSERRIVFTLIEKSKNRKASVLTTKVEEITSDALQVTVTTPDERPVNLHRFLLVLTLFRRSRYRSALSSWALLKAPGPLAFGGRLDNDRWRIEAAEKLVNELRKVGLFKVQAGGFIWMHDDVRFGLREKVINEHYSTEKDWLEVVAESHQGIADWYVKLFRSSGDSRALEEAVYHWLCCIGNSKIVGERSRQITAMRELGVTLELAGGELRHKGFHSGSYAMVDSIEENLIGGESGMDATRNGLVSTSMANLLEKSYWGGVDLSREELNYEKWWGYLQRLKAIFESLSVPSRNRLEREKVVFFESTRSYSLMEKKLDDLLNQLCESKDIKADILTFGAAGEKEAGEKEAGEKEAGEKEAGENPGLKKIGAVRNAAAKFAEAMETERVKEAVKLLRRYVQLCLLKAELSRLMNRDDIEAILKEGELLYVFSTAIMRYLEDSDFLQRENAFLRTHFALILGQMGRIQEADRRLNEASSYLSRSSSNRSKVAWAVIDIRRAELRLLESEKESVVKTGLRDVALTDERRRLLSLAKDSSDILNRACRRLRGQGQNLWWWTAIYNLLIRSQKRIAQLESEGGNQINFGAESCGLCRKYFREGSRLVRSDPLRLAMLISDYREAIDTEEEEKTVQPVVQRLLALWERRMKLDFDRDDIPPDVREYIEGVLASKGS